MNQRYFLVILNNCMNGHYPKFSTNVVGHIYSHHYSQIEFLDVPMMDDLELIQNYLPDGCLIEWIAEVCPPPYGAFLKLRMRGFTVIFDRKHHIWQFQMTFRFNHNLESDFRTFYALFCGFLSK